MAGTNTSINYEQLARLDYVFKQNAANKVKTDGLTGQTAISSDNERSACVPILRADRIWLDSAALFPGPRAIPWGSNVPVQVRTQVAMSDLHAIIPDIRGRSWKAPMGEWVSTEFNTSFAPVIYYAPSGTATPTNLLDATLYPFVIDYGSGILTFLGNTPAFLSNGTNILYMSGYTYTGRIGLSSSSNVTTSALTSNLSSGLVISNTLNAGPALHVVQKTVGGGSNAGSIAEFYDADNSSNIPAFKIADGGNVGIGTAVPRSSLHVVGDGRFSGTIETPNLAATNINEIFLNIANNTFVNGATVAVSAPTLEGLVTFTSAFKGTAASYIYNLSVANSSNVTVYTSPTRTCGSIDQVSNIFVKGTYAVSLNVRTNGTGAGSTYTAANVASFTVSEIDQVGEPYVAAIGTPSFSSNHTFVSGVPYYGNGTTVAFVANSLGFSNIYETVDPRTVLSRVLTLRDATNQTNVTDYSHNSVFADTLTANSSNTVGLSMHLTSSNVALVNIGANVYNVNYTNGQDNASLITNIAYVGTAISESTMNVASFTGMPIMSVIRKSIDPATASPTTPLLSEVQTFDPNNLGALDPWYSPYDGGAFYTIASNLPRGNYAPAFTAASGTHNQFLVKVTTNAPLSNFVVNFTNATNIAQVKVYWVAFGDWYDATVLYINPGGCAGATYNGGTRFPINIPRGQVLTMPTDIYINVQYTGIMPLSGIIISNS